MRVWTPPQSSTPSSGGCPPPPGKNAERSRTMPSSPLARTVASHSRRVASVSSSRRVPTICESTGNRDDWRRLMPLVVLRGGSRDGESTNVDGHVERRPPASEAPGVVDVDGGAESTAHLAGNDEPALVYNFVGQEPL